MIIKLEVIFNLMAFMTEYVPESINICRATL